MKTRWIQTVSMCWCMLFCFCTIQERLNPVDSEYSGKTGTLRGRVYLQGQNEHQGIIVRLDTYGRGDVVAETDPEGNFKLSGIPVQGSSPVTVVAEYPEGGYNIAKFEVTVQANSTKEMDSTEYRCLTRIPGYDHDENREPLTFDGLTGNLRGWVRFEQRRFHDGAHAMLVFPHGHANETVTDSSGMFELRNVPVGNAIVLIERDGYNPVRYSDFVVSSGSWATMDASDVKLSTIAVRGDILYVSTASGVSNVWRMRSDGSLNQQLTFRSDNQKAFKGMAFNIPEKLVAYVYGSATEDYWQDQIFMASIDDLNAGKAGIKLVDEQGVNPVWDNSRAEPVLYYEYLNTDDPGGTSKTIRCVDTNGNPVPCPGLDKPGWDEIAPDVNSEGKVLFARHRTGPFGFEKYQICVYNGTGIQVIDSSRFPAMTYMAGRPDEGEFQEMNIADSVLAHWDDPHTLLVDFNADGKPDFVNLDRTNLLDEINFCLQIRSPRWSDDGGIYFADNQGSSPKLKYTYFQAESLSVDTTMGPWGVVYYDRNHNGSFDQNGIDVEIDPDRPATWAVDAFALEIASQRSYSVQYIGTEMRVPAFEQVNGGDYIDRIAVSVDGSVCMVLGRVTELYGQYMLSGGQLWVKNEDLLRLVTKIEGNSYPVWVPEQELK